MNKIIIFFTIISLSGAVALFPVPVYGATVAELQSQINALLAQLQVIQSQSLSISDSGVSSNCSFIRNLTVGSRGEDVKCLQKYLNSASYYVVLSGAGSSGNETIYFGPATKSALSKWQAANGVYPASGYFGPITRSKYDSIASRPVNGSTTIITAPAPVPVSELPIIVPAAETPAVTVPVVSLPNPFDSTLKIEMILAPTTLSSYGEKTLAVFKLSSDEKIGITKIRFINKGTFRNSYITNFKLLANSDSGPVLADVSGLTDGTVEFNINSDNTKTDKGLLVSGNTYYLRGYLLVPSYGSEKPYIRMDIESTGDVSAYDYNDLNRTAMITKNNSFPIRGPQITAF